MIVATVSDDRSRHDLTGQLNPRAAIAYAIGRTRIHIHNIMFHYFLSCAQASIKGPKTLHTWEDTP